MINYLMNKIKGDFRFVQIFNGYISGGLREGFKSNTVE